jgi:hypothetical protein
LKRRLDTEALIALSNRVTSQAVPGLARRQDDDYLLQLTQPELNLLQDAFTSLISRVAPKTRTAQLYNYASIATGSALLALLVASICVYAGVEWLAVGGYAVSLISSIVGGVLMQRAMAR